MSAVGDARKRATEDAAELTLDEVTLLAYVSQVERVAEERGYQRGRAEADALRTAVEGAWSDLRAREEHVCSLALDERSPQQRMRLAGKSNGLLIGSNVVRAALDTTPAREAGEER